MKKSTEIKPKSGTLRSEKIDNFTSEKTVSHIKETLPEACPDTYWDDPIQKGLLEKCVKLDAYLSATIEFEFKHLSKSMKCFKEINKTEYENIIKQLKKAFRKCIYFETVKHVFKNSTTTPKNYLDDSVEVFVNTVTKHLTAAKTDKRTKKRNNTESKKREDFALVKSPILLPFFFFNYILRHEFAYDTISDRKRRYKKASEWRKSKKVGISGLFEIPDIEVYPSFLGKRYRKQYLTMLEKLDSPKTRPEDPHIYCLIAEESSKICNILKKYSQISIDNEIIRRQELFCRLGESLKNECHFLWLAYALALRTNLLIPFFALNLVKFDELLSKSKHFAENMQTLLENGCLSTAMHLIYVKEHYFTEEHLSQILKDKAEQQQKFVNAELEVTEELLQEIIRSINNEELFSNSLGCDLWECFSPTCTAVKTLNSVDEVNDIMGKILKFYNAYNELESKQDSLNSLYMRTLVEGYPHKNPKA